MLIELDDNIWLAEMPPLVKLVALAIAKHQNSIGEAAYPSETRLASMTGIGLSSVKRSIKWLVKHGCITVEHKLTKNSKWPVNHYSWKKGLLWLDPNKASKWGATVDGVQHDTQSSVVEGGASVDERGCHSGLRIIQ